MSLCSDHIKNGEKLCIRVCFSFFVFHAKSVVTNIYRNGSRDISYINHFNYDSSNIMKFQNIFIVEKNRLKIMDFRSNFELILCERLGLQNLKTLFKLTLRRENLILRK